MTEAAIVVAPGASVQADLSQHRVVARGAEDGNAVERAIREAGLQSGSICMDN